MLSGDRIMGLYSTPQMKGGNSVTFYFFKLHHGGGGERIPGLLKSDEKEEIYFFGERKHV